MPKPIDERLHDLYLTLDTRLSGNRINALFSESGWSSRMCAWTEYEITSEFAELVIASESPVLISGGINRDPDSLDRILSILDHAGVAYRFEIYDENDCLIRSHP